jgi:NTE family protein
VPTAAPSRTDAERRANQALLVAATAMFLASFVTTASNIAIPVLEKAFPETELSTLSWVISAFNVTQVTFMLLGGRLADRWGRRPVFLTGMTIFAVGAALSAVAPVIGLVIAARVVQAIGVALVLPSSLAAVLPLFPIDRHASVVSLWSAMGIFGSAVAPTIAAGILQVGSWRMVFATVVPFAALAWWGGRARLAAPPPRDPAFPPPPLDLVGTVAGTVAVGGLALAVVQGRHWGWASPAVVGVVAAAVGAGVLFVWRSLHHPAPLLDLTLLRVRSFRVVTVAAAFIATATAATWYLYPLFMTGVWGYSIFRVGLAISPGAFAMIPITILAGRIADRSGYRTLLVAGSFIATAGVTWLAWRLVPGSSYVVGFLPGTLMIGAGMGLMMGPANSAALRDVAEKNLGAANAAYNTMRFLGMALGVAVAAAVVGDSQGPERAAALHRALWVNVALMAAGPVLLLLAYPRKPPSERATAAGSGSGGSVTAGGATPPGRPVPGSR